MRSFSAAVDGFFSVKEGVDEMINFLANEPSVGLFFVQQHAQSSMPRILNLEDTVEEKIHEVTLQTEDTEDSICVVRSMAECGVPIVDEMINDIHKSLVIMSKSQPRKGLIRNPSWGYQTNGRHSGGSSQSYLSAVFSSALEKAAGFRRSQPDGELLSSATKMGAGTFSTPLDTEGDELPMSSSSTLDDRQPDESAAVRESLCGRDAPLMLESYGTSKSARELKLQEWLQEPEDHTK